MFREPIILRGNGGIRSQFGMSLASLNNIDGDDRGYNDFAVGAPFAEDGQGAVFVYHGNVPEKFSTKPAQESKFFEHNASDFHFSLRLPIPKTGWFSFGENVRRFSNWWNRYRWERLSR